MKCIPGLDPNQFPQSGARFGCRATRSFTRLPDDWYEGHAWEGSAQKPPKFTADYLGANEPVVSYLEHFFKWVWCIRPNTGCSSPERVTAMLTSIRSLVNPRFESHLLPWQHLKQDPKTGNADSDLTFDYMALQIKKSPTIARRVRSREIPETASSRVFEYDMETEEDELEFDFSALRIGKNS